MHRLPQSAQVHVDGPANQWPFERVVDNGTIIGHHPKQGYLVQLKQHCENLYFRRRDLVLNYKKPCVMLPFSV